MSDIVQRLRAGLEAGAIDLADIMDAADEIERLRDGTAVWDNCPSRNDREMPCPVTEPMPKEIRAEVSDTNHDAVPEAKAMHSRDCSGGLSGTGDSLSKAEIDALQHVVEDGRIVKMQDYCHLRSLLVRLRPEWEDEDQEPERTRGVRHTQSECTKQGEGSVPDSTIQRHGC